jgi:hypothetical protein
MKPNNKHTNTGPTDPLWNGPKVIKSKTDVENLAKRWASALLSGWEDGYTADKINPANVLAQYAPDGAMSFRSKSGSGLATGSQLLATLENDPLTTNALRKGYFDTFLLKGPTPTLKAIEYRQLSKVGEWVCLCYCDVDDTRSSGIHHVIPLPTFPLITSTPYLMTGRGNGRRHLGLRLCKRWQRGRGSRDDGLEEVPQDLHQWRDVQGQCPLIDIRGGMGQ